MPQASNPFRFNSEGSDQGTIGRAVSGLQSSALKSPVKFDQDGRVEQKFKSYAIRTEESVKDKNTTSRKAGNKFTASFAPKCNDIENEKLQSLEDRIRHQLNKINEGTPGPGLYNSDIHTIDKKFQNSKPFASLRSHHEAGSTGTFDLIDQRMVAKS